jgi:acetyl esterase/lipase
LRDEGTALPKNAIILSPLGDLTYTGSSREYNKRADPVVPVQRILEMQAMYMGQADAKNRYLSPLLADFDGLPPMLGMVGSTEILLDDTIRASNRAATAEVPFNLEIWEQMPHVFPFFAVLPESEVAIDRIAKFINQHTLEPLPSRHGREKANRKEQRALSGR